MEPDEVVTLIHNLIKQSNRELGAAVTSLVASAPHVRHLKPHVALQIGQAMAALETANNILTSLEHDQSCWGHYNSHKNN